MRFLRQSTAQTVTVGPYLDIADGVTEEIALSPGVEVGKNGAAFILGPTGVHDVEGWYSVALTTGHTDTLGSLILKSHSAANHLPVWHEFTVLPATIYDAFIAGTGTFPVNNDAIADAHLDRTNAIENSMTPRQALRVIASSVGAKSSGGGTTTVTFRNAVQDSKDRIIATVDGSGNRSAITYDLD